MPRKNLVLFLALLFAAALGISRAFSEDKNYDKMRTFTHILDRVMNEYVEEVKAEDLFEGAYQGMLSRLDPYTQYFNIEESQSFAEDTEGKFGGLGIEISIKDGVLTVISPIRGTPAYEAGVLAGDRVLKIDGKSTERISLYEAVKLLRGAPGSKVTITVRHVGGMTDEDVVVTRAIIKPHTVEYEVIEGEGIGYMRVGSFTARVMEEFRKGAEDMRAQGMEALILDLRQNPGGLLPRAVEMCDEFIADGVVVSVKGRGDVLQEVYRARAGHALETIPLVVLIDGGSASASEIVAGCIRDYKRGIIIGDRSYGKGSVQNVIPLGNGAALKMTTAHYYTPADKPIKDRQGIMPDIFIPIPREHMIALRNQEREDKLRDRFKLTGALESQNEVDEKLATEAPAAPEGEKAPENGKNGDGDGDAENVRRGRVVDFQLKAAVNILKYKLVAARN